MSQMRAWWSSATDTEQASKVTTQAVRTMTPAPERGSQFTKHSFTKTPEGGFTASPHFINEEMLRHMPQTTELCSSEWQSPDAKQGRCL